MRTTATAILAIIWCLCVSSTGECNGLPLTWPAPGSGSPWPAEHPAPAAIISEDLSITFVDPHPVGRGDVLVTAHYRLAAVERSQPVTFPVAFILDGAWSELEVTLNDVLVPIDSAAIDIAGLGTDLDLEHRTYDPLTGAEYGMTGGSSRVHSVQLFHLYLEPETVHDLIVTYRGETGYDRLRYINPIHHCTYFLTPAQKWADFGRLSLTITVPPGYKVATSLDQYLHSEGRGVFTAELPGLPDDNLHIAVMSGAGTWSGVVTRRQASRLWLLSAGLYVGVNLAGALKRLRGPAALWLVMVSCWVFSRGIWHYPLDFLQLPVLVLILLSVAAMEIRRWRRKRVQSSDHG